jgi:cystathionine beta-lyase/cystathionine gamma-synthase
MNNTPNHKALAGKIAAIEGAEAAVVTSSGMAAITAVILAHVAAGDHVLLQRTVYGGTRTFFDHQAARFGLQFTPVDTTSPAGWDEALTPQTKVFYVEGISNPLLEVADLKAVVAFCKRNGLTAIIDNTFLTPVNYRPLEHGFDVVVHSATKYLNGHSDIVAGAIAGSHKAVEAAGGVLLHLGGTLDPHACFLLERGLKTLGLRVRQQNQTAMALAQALVDHPAVATVCYPGLPTDPGAARAAAFRGCGGMVSFFLNNAADADRFFEGLTIPIQAASLGGVETLAIQPALSTHLGMAKADLEALGITNALIRISVGIEDPSELIGDILRALDG